MAIAARPAPALPRRSALDNPFAGKVGSSARKPEETHVANIASAIKRARQMVKRRTRNRAAMSTLRTAIKRARTAVDTKAADAAEQVKAAISTIDKAVSRGVLKKQTASRYVSRLSLRKSA